MFRFTIPANGLSALICSAAVFTAGSSLAAQSDPVEVRVRHASYGSGSQLNLPIDPLLTLRVVADADGIALVASGGLAGQSGMLLVSDRPADVQVGDARILVGLPAVPVSGSFDDNGELRLDLDPDQLPPNGQTIYAQALHAYVDGPISGVTLSAGVRVDWIDGNAQPDERPYTGPEFHASALVDESGPSGSEWTVLAAVTVTSGGYAFSIGNVERVGNATRVDVVLTAPAPGTPVIEPIVTHRLAIPLEDEPGQRIELRLQQRIGGVYYFRDPSFELAAIIDAAF